MTQKLLVLFFPFLTANLCAQSHADCDKAMDICKKQSYSIDKTGGEGANNREADFMSCFMNGENNGQAEENSTWIKFEIEKSGTLTFVITPHKVDDDIDFVVYKLPSDGKCRFDAMPVVRCMAAGDAGFTAATSPCMGETGLREGELDTSEDAGCSDAGDNAWLAPLKVVAGEKYMVLVSNVSSRGPGFTIRFGGSAKLPCDEEKVPEPVKPKPPVSTPAKPTPKPPVAVQAPAAPAPANIGGRKVEVGETVKVKNRKIKVKIWDSQVEDGDIVSIFLDEKKVVDRVYLRLKPQEFEITLPPGKKEYYLTVYAEDFGKAEPNSAMVLIYDGVREQTIDLVAGRSKQESVKIIAE
jgi:hypothetical protein